MSYILYVCIIVPFALMFLILYGGAKRTAAFVMIGITVCLFVSEINSLLLDYFNDDIYFVTTRITPITEEIFKALPVIYFGIVFSDDIQKLLTVGMAVGIGFAVFENMIILTDNIENVNILWAFIRGFGSGLMHGMSTAIVGICMSSFHRRKKLFVPGLFSLLSVAIINHGIYNLLVQSKLEYLGYILPIIIYIPISIFSHYLKKKHQKQKTLQS